MAHWRTNGFVSLTNFNSFSLAHMCGIYWFGERLTCEFRNLGHEHFFFQKKKCYPSVRNIYMRYHMYKGHASYRASWLQLTLKTWSLEHFCHLQDLVQHCRAFPSMTKCMSHLRLSCDLPWCITFTNHDTPIHMTIIYFSIPCATMDPPNHTIFFWVPLYIHDK